MPEQQNGYTWAKIMGGLLVAMTVGNWIVPNWLASQRTEQMTQEAVQVAVAELRAELRGTQADMGRFHERLVEMRRMLRDMQKEITQILRQVSHVPSPPFP